jgi:hypothetical protein
MKIMSSNTTRLESKAGAENSLGSERGLFERSAR